MAKMTAREQEVVPSHGGGDLRREAFDRWTQGRRIQSIGTNAGATPIAFQGWHRFKEAFPPELVAQAVDEHSHDVEAIIDPFGGSGTTSLACRFLGLRSTTFEINPFLADVIQAKLAPYDGVDLNRVLDEVCVQANVSNVNINDVRKMLPPTLVQPGVNNRWVYSTGVAKKILALRNAIEELEEPCRRLLLSLLGGVLVDLSNVRINGKGRRYRQDWQSLERQPDEVEAVFRQHCKLAFEDIADFEDVVTKDGRVFNSDARQLSTDLKHSLAVFSPPYPNSFDYTDVYNLELWMLGYLDRTRNRTLRASTLASHVQIHRAFAMAPRTSTTLKEVLSDLEAARSELWNRRIPDMVGGYFADMAAVLAKLADAVVSGGACHIVVGDSQYSGIAVPTATILAELAPSLGWAVQRVDAFRTMRTSAQQGGAAALAESLLVLMRVPTREGVTKKLRRSRSSPGS